MRPGAVLLAALMACSCTQAPAPTADPSATQPARDPRLDVAPASGQDPPERLTGTMSQLRGTTAAVTSGGSALAGVQSGLQGLVDALGGQVVGNEIQVALPADTLFEFDQADVLPAAEANLRLLAELVSKTRGIVELRGYTDAKGDDAYNLALSKRRADAVSAWLQSTGIDATRLQATGFGEAAPVAPNETPDGRDDEAGRARNRRVIAVIPTSGMPATGSAATDAVDVTASSASPR